MQKIVSAVSSQIQQFANPTVTKRYKLEGTIGKGNFSQVKRATDRQTGQEVAVKVLSLATLKDKEKALTQIDREIDIMKLIDHPHCIKLLDVYKSSSHIYMVLELMSGGELFDRIIAKEHYSETEAAQCFVQIMGAIEYLHAMGIVHRDIKPENVLYATPADDSPVKIADFGFGKIINFDGDVMRTMCGTPTFVAPEVIARKVRPGSTETYGKACDVWSAGVLLYCMLSGEHPFDQDAGISDLFRQITAGAYSFRPEVWGEISTEAKDLVRSMMTVDADRRITAANCMRHPWVARLKDGQMSSKALTGAQMKLRDRHEALAKRKLLGFAAAGGAGNQFASKTVGCLIAKGEALEVVSINSYGKQLLACAADPDPAPTYVQELLAPSFHETHTFFMNKVMRDRSLPRSIQHPLRSVEMFRKDGTTGRFELLVGKLDEAQGFDGETLFFGYFVPTAESATGGQNLTLKQKMEKMYGADFASKLLSGEARPLPEYYDEVTVSAFTLPDPARLAPAVMDIAGRYRIHVMRGADGRFICVAGTNHVRHDLSFDQTERTVGFVAELVSSLPDVRFPVGVAVGPAAVTVGLTERDRVACYTPSGRAHDAAIELERTGRAGYMHLSWPAADRLGAERGLFMDFDAAVAAGSEGGAAGSAGSRGSSPRRGPGAEPGPSGSQDFQEVRGGGAALQRRGSVGSGGAGAGRSVWIDCFHVDQVLTSD